MYRDNTQTPEETMNFDSARIHQFAETAAQGERANHFTQRDASQLTGIALSEAKRQAKVAYWDAVASAMCDCKAENLPMVVRALLFAHERELVRAQQAENSACYEQHEITGDWLAEAESNVAALRQLLTQVSK